MEKLRHKLQRFMIGRYGIDELYRFLFIVYTVLLIINCFLRSSAISVILWILLIYTIFRIVSKDISARQRENARYLVLKNKAYKFFRNAKERAKDKNHVYRKCPHCKATLRFPRKKGNHNAICPKCHLELKVNIPF